MLVSAQSLFAGHLEPKNRDCPTLHSGEDQLMVDVSQLEAIAIAMRAVLACLIINDPGGTIALVIRLATV